MSDPDPFADFRPQRSRIVSICAAIGIVVVFTIVALSVPHGGSTGWNGPDSAAMIAFGVLLAAFLLKFAMVRATPNERGLHVKNLMVTRDVTWAEIVNVQFGGGHPWLVLELADTETLSVMAVQRSDGEHAVDEAGRMAALVQAHLATEIERPQGD
ncbi:PH domain-containing protein [Rudaeicoccus suwonensis]|uniref:PH domain-containing protein n=1 Tax=Rudaeicoccus suwonensis TaxID=657409 RepID=UPI0011AA80B0|nr:PH domain-containing protein [Rudaeicoccus suwonensis]